MASLNDGEVVLMLGDKEYVLRPTLRAIKALSRQHGGLRAVLEHIAAQNFDGLVSIIKIGASVPDREDAALENLVFKAGMTDNLLQPLLSYWRVLQNGGKPPPPEEHPVVEGDAEADTGND